MDVSIPCPCPNTPHETDTVYLRDTLDFHRVQSIIGATAFIENDDDASRAAEVLATVNEGYLLHGIERWTLRDGSKAIPVTKANIRRYVIEDANIYPPVLAAADMYAAAVLLPLGIRASNSSQPSPTDESTSPKRGRGSGRRPKQSSPSSISTIPTDATATTTGSPGGDSSFSPSSESAA